MENPSDSAMMLLSTNRPVPIHLLPGQTVQQNNLCVQHLENNQGRQGPHSVPVAV